jgi:hypothetical protein
MAGQAGAQLLGEYGDAPEGVNAYPNLGFVLGQFPTCVAVGPATFVYHGPLCWSHFPGLAPPFDFEIDGNGGVCPQPPYDFDECFLTDAGILFPFPYTIDAANNIVPCPGAVPSTLGPTCTVAQWGINLDIMVTNQMPVPGYFNLLVDHDMNGTWNGGSNCPGVGTAWEHAVVNFFPVPIGFTGPLSLLGPPPFLLGPNQGYVWTRFTVSESPVPTNWNGAQSFEDGETEDYLFFIGPPPSPVEDSTWGTIKGLYR